MWSIRLIAHAYGRAELIVETPNATYYVHDPALGCPAEGFMASLLMEVYEKMQTSDTCSLQ